MTLYEQLHTGEVKELRVRFHELYGTWPGLHWEAITTIEELKVYMRQKIAEKEQELSPKAEAT